MVLPHPEEAFDVNAGWADLGTGVMAELASWTDVRAVDPSETSSQNHSLDAISDCPE